MKKRLRGLRIGNTCLEAGIFILALSFILAPLLPAVTAFFSKDDVVAVESDAFDPQTLFADVPPEVDYLIIPSLGIKKEIIEAETMKVVHELVWRRPQGSTPDAGSNTVLVAHRYATIGGNRASTFYFLPDIMIGDPIYVRWKGVIYEYDVAGTTTVLPTQIEIEDPTDAPILTLYTCTPLWKADKRFVVTAPLVQTYE